MENLQIYLFNGLILIFGFYVIVYFYQRLERTLFVKNYKVTRLEAGLIQDLKNYYIALGISPADSEKYAVESFKLLTD